MVWLLGVCSGVRGIPAALIDSNYVVFDWEVDVRVLLSLERHRLLGSGTQGHLGVGTNPDPPVSASLLNPESSSAHSMFPLLRAPVILLVVFLELQPEDLSLQGTPGSFPTSTEKMCSGFSCQML